MKTIPDLEEKQTRQLGEYGELGKIRRSSENKNGFMTRVMNIKR